MKRYYIVALESNLSPSMLAERIDDAHTTTHIIADLSHAKKTGKLPDVLSGIKEFLNTLTENKNGRKT